MQDQVMALNARNISACFLGSAQTDPRVAIDAWNGKYSFIYVTPELAVNRLSSLADLHRRVGLALLAIDEAHCVSEWGLDFRPEYRQLHTIRQHLQGVPIMALTATATPRVRSDIVTNLQLASSNLDQWVQSFERPNLYFEVCRKGTSMAATLRPMLDDIAVQPTIIYCVTRRETQAVADILSAHTPLTGRVGVYHADLPMAERHRVHAAFMRDQITVVCCTIAFAMGIDKSNVRKVIHYGIASSLEGYYQVGYTFSTCCCCAPHFLRFSLLCSVDILSFLTILSFSFFCKQLPASWKSWERRSACQMHPALEPR